MSAKQAYLGKESAAKRIQQETLCAQLARRADADVIAVAYPGVYLQLAHYASPELADRLVYSSSQERSLRYWGHNTMDRALEGIKPLTHWKIEDYDSFVAGRPRFLVHGTGGWLLPALLADGAQIELTAPRLCHVRL